MAKAHKAPPSLAAATFMCFLLGALVLAMGLVLFLPHYARAVSDRALERAVQTRTSSAALDFARALHADWREVQFLAQTLANTPPEGLRLALDGLTGSGVRISWSGLAGLDGRLVAGSAGLLDGADVSARPWFEAGLRGRYAGDVHDAVLLNRLLGGSEEEPLRFIDFSLPVTDVAGSVVGVLATHTSFDWVEAFLNESAAVRQIDLFLVNAAGQLIHATTPVPVEVEAVAALRSAITGTAAQTRETWPDGSDYFATVVPQVAYADLPSFGWRLVGRVPTDTMDADLRALFGSLALVVAGGITAFGAAAALFALIFLRPVAHLVESAERIAEGQDDYPSESRTSAEATRLSWALARIQSRLHARDSKVTVSDAARDEHAVRGASGSR